MVFSGLITEDIPFSQIKGIRDPDFYYTSLSDHMKRKLIKNKLWKEGCPVSLERLSQLRFKYFNIDFEEKVGTLIVNTAAASKTLDILKKLYDSGFKIRYIARDLKTGKIKGFSTASFSCRAITGGGSISIHSYGLAIDINVPQNPYVGLYKIDESNENIATANIIPHTQSALRYMMDRKNTDILLESQINTFKHFGYIEWGGDWSSIIDYMHIQTTRTEAEMIAAMDLENSKRLFELGAKHPDLVSKFTNSKVWIELYNTKPNSFMKIIANNINKFKATDEETFFKFIKSKINNDQERSKDLSSS